jgi:hypothetical protein
MPGCEDAAEVASATQQTTEGVTLGPLRFEALSG